MAVKKFISLSTVQVGIGSGEPIGEGSPYMVIQEPELMTPLYSLICGCQGCHGHRHPVD